MAEKRKIGIYDRGVDEDKEQVTLPGRYRDVGWRQWLREDFARYWYGILVLIVDVMLGLQVAMDVQGMGMLGFFLVIAIAIPPEVLIYLYLWGKNGILMSKE